MFSEFTSRNIIYTFLHNFQRIRTKYFKRKRKTFWKNAIIFLTVNKKTGKYVFAKSGDLFKGTVTYS